MGGRADACRRARGSSVLTLDRVAEFLGEGLGLRSIALANQKGGVGKTTTAIHLAHGFALAGKRVVLLDLDPQGNATVALQGMETQSTEATPAEHLVSLGASFWLLPSHGVLDLLSGAPMDRAKMEDYCRALEPAVDVMIVDSPPRMDEWGWTGVQLSDEVLIPVQSEFLAMHGLSQMLSLLDAASSGRPGKGVLRGIVPTMVDPREPVTLEVLADLRQNLGGRVVDSLIFRDAALVEAASFGRSAFQHCPWSKGALCYAELTMELIDGGPTTR